MGDIVLPLTGDSDMAKLLDLHEQLTAASKHPWAAACGDDLHMALVNLERRIGEEGFYQAIRLRKLGQNAVTTERVDPT